MFNLMITAPASNSGKTAVTCGLISLFKEMGFNPRAFKCGPDYIDPMFHRSVMGVSGSNLDVFLAGEEGVKNSFINGCRNHDAVICEGVMGYYDGYMPGSDVASAWHVADILNLPAVLVVRPKGSALTVAALIKGIAEFRKPSHICGVILNECSEKFFRTYGDSIEKESGVSILGHLPHMEDAGFESRHLGLMTTEEVRDVSERIKRIGKRMRETVDIRRLIEICSRDAACDSDIHQAREQEKGKSKNKNERKSNPVIAVARDAAFSFIYEESLVALQTAGADIKFFSPMKDMMLPDGTDGIYLPGGYPELYAKELSHNISMREKIRVSVKKGTPVIAECGGFLYLSDKLADHKGITWDMAGVFRGTGKNTGRPVRFGYGFISAEEDSMLLRRGERVPVHEFHYWDTDNTGNDMHFEKPYGMRSWGFGFASDTMYAGFPHLYLAGNDGLLAKRFVEAAKRKREKSRG